MIDTTFVQPITTLIQSPAIQGYLITAIIACLTFIFGLLKIPKGIAAGIVHYGIIVTMALVKSTRDERREPSSYSNDELNSIAAKYLQDGIATSPKKSLFNKITDILGGSAKVISYAYPIAKPLLKSIFPK